MNNNDDALYTLLRCRRATSNDDSVTLKNCSSDSTLNGDVMRAPASRRCDVTDTTQRVLPSFGLFTFNPFGCRRYSTAEQLQHAVPVSSAGNPVMWRGRPPNPPRRTTSLSSTVTLPEAPSLSPPPAVDKTSEIQRLASLAEKLAAHRRIFTVFPHTLPTQRPAPALLADPNSPLFRDKSRTFAAVTSSPSSHRLDITASCLSAQSVAEKNEVDERSASATDVTGHLPQLSATVTAVRVDDESASETTLRKKQLVSYHRADNCSNSVSSQNSGRENVASVDSCTESSAGPGEVSQLRDEEDHSTQNVDNRDLAVDRRPTVQDVSHDCSELDVSQSTTLVSSSVKDSLMMTADDCGASPLPVAARLIITSPVSSRACFVENPHRRSMCKPLTLPLPRIDDDVYPASGSVQIRDPLHPVTSLRRHCDPQLPVVVANCNDDVDPTNYGRSWYDVLRGDKGRCDLGITVADPRICMSAHPPAVVGAGVSLGGDYASSDTRSVSSQSSLVSDNCSQVSGSLRRPVSRPIATTSALNGDQVARPTVRINAPSPVLSNSRRWTPSSSRAHHSARSFSASTARDHVVADSSADESVDRIVAKGVNLKRLKKSRQWMKEQPGKDVDVDLNADIHRLSYRRTADRTMTNTEFVSGPTNDGRENETESRAVFTSFTSNSLGRHKSLRTCSKFADHCSAAGNIIVSPQLWTAATTQQ